MTVATPDRGEADARLRRVIQAPPVESEAARRELVRRIVKSPTFARSERLGTLLTYICDMTLNGHEAEINEQNIGHKVFGRSKDYDSAVDGIVRSQASRLRQRLELYFQQEGADEPVRIVIPRGGYVPLFEPQIPAAEAPSEDNRIELLPQAVPPAISHTHPKDSFVRRWWLSLVLSIMLLTLWIHDLRRQMPAAPIPQTHPFWSHLFSSRQPAMIVAPDSGLVIYHGMSGKDVTLNEYLDGEYRTEPDGPLPIGPSAPRKNWLFDLANRRYTSMVDLKAILRLKDRAQAMGSEVSVRYARDLRPNDLKTSSTILLGAASANPWVGEFEHSMNFVLGDDYTKLYWVENRHPQKDEPARWETLRNDPQQRVYGLVAYLPNLAGDGNTLIIEGTSMAGTEASMDFIDDDTQLLSFLNRIRRSDGTLPHFELLLEAHNMGSSAVRSQILAWRTMN